MKKLNSKFILKNALFDVLVAVILIVLVMSDVLGVGLALSIMAGCLVLTAFSLKGETTNASKKHK